MLWQRTDGTCRFKMAPSPEQTKTNHVGNEESVPAPSSTRAVAGSAYHGGDVTH
jgi:hypothetical protein